MTSTAPVAIVMPVVNGASTVLDALESCFAQDYDGPLEVVVALGPSNDDSASILAGYDGVTVVDNPTGATPAGLNAAIAATDAPIIVRCDAQARLPAGYVRMAVAALDDTGAAVVGGRQVAKGTTPFELGVALAMASPIGAGGARFRRGGPPGPVETVYLGVFDRTALEAVGGFDDRWLRNQDYELNHRLRSSGAVVWFTPELEVEYRPRSTLRDLWRQFHDYGRWKRAMISIHPGSFRLRQAASPVFVLAAAASLVAAPWLGWVAPVAVFGLYAAVVAVGTATVAPRPGWMWFPVATATMHTAWGSGFIRGGVERRLRA